MDGILQSKLEELKQALAEQRFSPTDEAEIEAKVREYKQKLTDEKEAEYKENKKIIEAQIDLVENLIVAEKEKADKEKVEEVNPLPQTPNLL